MYHKKISLFTKWKHMAKVTIYKPERESSPENDSCWTLILNFPVFRAVKN
jgi:hypothetical protein